MQEKNEARRKIFCAEETVLSQCSPVAQAFLPVRSAKLPASGELWCLLSGPDAPTPRATRICLHSYSHFFEDLFE